ncbi:MAG: nucleotidyltransferase domain-containing protein [Melioribacteraceae bacterium]|nr:nucleotidyltransferase domain-containing protein [Melioribacteraceae bacterium]
MAIKTDREIKRIVKEYTRLLINAGLPVVKIILFGSYALKKASDNSDIDLAIVFKELKEDRFETRLKLMKFSRKFNEVIEPHPFLNSEFNETNPFASEILKNGITLYS